MSDSSLINEDHRSQVGPRNKATSKQPHLRHSPLTFDPYLLCVESSLVSTPNSKIQKTKQSMDVPICCPFFTNQLPVRCEETMPRDMCARSMTLTRALVNNPSMGRPRVHVLPPSSVCHVTACHVLLDITSTSTSHTHRTHEM